MIDYRKDGNLHLVTMHNGQNTICPHWQQRMLEILDSVESDCGQGAALVLAGIVDGKAAMDALPEQAKSLATQLGTKEPEIFKTLKQTWFGPMAEALVAS